MRGREQKTSLVRRLASAGSGEPFNLDQEEGESEPVGDWEGTVELAETVTVPPLSVRIAWCRVVRRNSSTVVKVPRNQEILVDPEGLPGVYLARIVATLENDKSSLNVGGSPPFMVNTKKSSLVELVVSPSDKCNTFVAESDGDIAADVTSSNGEAGSGECLPKVPEGGLPAATTSRKNDLHAESHSHPVENKFGTQVDTLQINMAQVNKEGTIGQQKEE